MKWVRSDISTTIEFFIYSGYEKHEVRLGKVEKIVRIS